MESGGTISTSAAVSYSGQGFSLRGDKDRFVLPSDLRKAVRDSGHGERVLCLAKHPRWKCLIGFGLGRVAQLEAEIDRDEEAAIRRGESFDRDFRLQQAYGFARIPFDDSGRFVMPERYFRLGGLADRIYLQGAGRWFTLWNPAELAAMGAGWEDAQAACADLEALATAAKARK